jgi:hypothetical protein
MDSTESVLTIGYGLGNVDVIRDLGLTLVTPLNTPLMDPQDLVEIWNHVSTQEYEFNDFERGNAQGFIVRLLDMRHLHIIIGKMQGYCILLNAWCGDSPELHFCIWDQEMSRTEVLRAAGQVMKFVFSQLNAVRVTAFIPVFNPEAAKLATILGFRFEGELRKGVLWQGKHHNVSIYGLLKEDWNKRVRN